MSPYGRFKWWSKELTAIRSMEEASPDLVKEILTFVGTMPCPYKKCHFKDRWPRKCYHSHELEMEFPLEIEEMTCEARETYRDLASKMENEFPDHPMPIFRAWLEREAVTVAPTSIPQGIGGNERGERGGATVQHVAQQGAEGGVNDQAADE